MNSGGKEIVAEMVGVADANVILKMKGKDYEIPTASLSSADQVFISEQLQKEKTAHSKNESIHY